VLVVKVGCIRHMPESMMCDAKIGDSEKLGFLTEYKCHNPLTVDKQFHQQSMIYHPDRKTLFSSNEAFNCLENARQRLKRKKCNYTQQNEFDAKDFTGFIQWAYMRVIILFLFYSGNVYEIACFFLMWTLNAFEISTIFLILRTFPTFVEIAVAMRRGKNLQKYDIDK